MGKTKKMYKNLWDLTSKSRFRSKVGIPPIGASVSYYINVENGQYTDLSTMEKLLHGISSKNSFKGIGENTCFISINNFSSEDIVKRLKEFSELHNLKMSNEKVIPKNVYFTYYDLNKIPKYVLNNIKKYCNGFNIHIYDDEMCKKFLKENYGDKMAQVFDSFKSGAHKADLWRYCILYLLGGVLFRHQNRF